MWITKVYSEGDLSHDEYLLSDDGENPKYQSAYDVIGRIEHIQSCIERLRAEQDFLIHHGGDLVGHTCYDCIDF